MLLLIQEEFEDTKGVIRIQKSKKNRQHNSGQKKKYKKTTTTKKRPTKHTRKTKDRVTRTPLQTGGELMCPRGLSSVLSENPYIVFGLTLP